MSNENNNTGADDIILYFIAAIIAGIAIYYASQNYLKIPAFNALNYTYSLVNTYPFLKHLASVDNYRNLVQEYQMTRFMIPENRAIQQLNVVFAYYLWLLVPFSLFLLWRTHRATMAITYTKKIESLETLVHIKENEFPTVKAGFQIGTAITKNQELARFGKHAQEYGPIRWAIFNGILTLNGNICYFKGHLPDEMKTLQNTHMLNDDIDELLQLKGKFDYNGNRLHSVLKNQLGKPFKHYTQLPDHQIALCNMFLTYSKGKKGKKAAQSLRDKYAKSFSIQKVGTAKEKVFFQFARKSEVSMLTKLINERPDKLITSASFDRLFVLSCYAKAKLDGADITPAEFTWVKSIDRELYLLLNSYTGDPSRLKNNGFVEIYAAMTQWLNLFELVSIDRRNNTTNASGFFEPQNNSQSLILKQILKEKIFVQDGSVNLSSGLNKQEEKDIHSIIDAFLDKKKSVDVRDSIEKNKRFSRIPTRVKLNNKDEISMIKKYNFSDFSEMCMSIFFMRLENSIKNTANESVSLSTVNAFCKNYSWLQYTDYRLYARCVTLLMLMQATKLSFNQICRSDAKSPESIRVSQAVNESLSKYKLMDAKIVPLNSKNENSNLLDGWALVTLYKISCANSHYSTPQLNALISDSSHAIRKSMLAFRYYMSSFEQWLRPEYVVPLERLLGDMSDLSDISEVK